MGFLLNRRVGGRLEAACERTAAFVHNETKILFTSQYGMCILFWSAVWGSRSPREESMKFGVIGAGRIGKIHAGNVAARKDCAVAFVADADAGAAESLAKSTGARVGTVEEILAASDVDAVAICSPTDTHAELIERAARAKKAIFCEKPIDLSADRVRKCLDVVEAAGATLMIGFNRRFDHNFASLRARIADGLIGELEMVSITSRDPGSPPISYIARSGGLFRDMMIHDFDMARFLLGEEPVAISAMGSALVDKAIGEAGDVDTAVVIMETKSGKVAQISNSRRATYGYDQRIEAHGAKGMLRADNVRETTVEFAGAEGFSSDKILNFFLERYATAYRDELAAFVAAVSSGKPTSPSGEDGLRAQLLADAANLSWRPKQRVLID